MYTLIHQDGSRRAFAQSLRADLCDALVTTPPALRGDARTLIEAWLGPDAEVPSLWRAFRHPLKPGAYALALVADQSAHLLTVAMCLGGFEVRDTICTLAGSTVIVGRKPLAEKSCAGNVARWQTGGLNINACRVAARAGQEPKGCKGTGWASQNRKNAEQGFRPNDYYEDQDGFTYRPHQGGRWPANVVHDGGSTTLAAFAAFGEKGNGWTRNYGDEDYVGRQYDGGTFGGGGYLGGSTYCDSGTAARFFQALPTRVALLAYLMRLVTPPGGVVFDPWLHGTDAASAAQAEGFTLIGSTIAA